MSLQLLLYDERMPGCADVVRIDREADRGVYVEPNVRHHRLSGV